MKRIEQIVIETNAATVQSIAQRVARESELADRSAALEAEASKLRAQEKHNQIKLTHLLDELRALKLAGKPERAKAVHAESELLERELLLYGDGDWNAWWKKLEPFRIELASVKVPGKLNFTMNSGERDWVLKEDLNSPNNGGLSPLEMMADFAGQLESRGIDFIFIPIPAKTEVYPDYWVHSVPPDLHVAPMSRRMLYDLSKANIEVIDLLPDFLKVRDQFKDTLYCGQNADHHWTFSGSKYAATLIAERLKRYDFVQAALRKGARYTLEESTFNTGIRTLACWHVFDAQGKLYEDAENSPILVVGDSNIRLGGVKGGNLTAYLAAELGMRLSIYQVDAFQPCQLNQTSPELFKNRKVVIYVGLLSLLHDSSITLKPVYLP